MAISITAVADATYGDARSRALPRRPSAATRRSYLDVMKQAADIPRLVCPSSTSWRIKGLRLAEANHRVSLEARLGIPIIAIRKTPRGQTRHEGSLYTNDGAYQRVSGWCRNGLCSAVTQKKGHLYRCRQEGCHLKERRQGVRYCHDAESGRTDRTTLDVCSGKVRRGSQEVEGPVRDDGRAWSACSRVSRNPGGSKITASEVSIR